MDTAKLGKIAFALVDRLPPEPNAQKNEFCYEFITTCVRELR